MNTDRFTRSRLAPWLTALATAAALATSPASAAVAPSGNSFDWGAHDQDEGEWVNVKGSGVSFVDVIRFSLGTTADLGWNSLVLSFLPTSDVAGTLSLFADGGSMLWSGALGAGGSLAALAAGNYYYEISGSTSGSRGGSYAVLSSVSAVPEVETYAMMLAGLGVVGFIAMRRRRRD